MPFYKKKINNECIEFQVCRKNGTDDIKALTAVEAIVFDALDSLYVPAEKIETFLQDYGELFNEAIHNNLTKSDFDPYGINYYTKEKAQRIMDQLEGNKAIYCEELAAFLAKAINNNGFYILGI